MKRAFAKWFHWIMTSLILVTQSALSDSGVTKVGVSLPLSGIAMEYGIATKNGIEMAQSEYPESFTDIKFIFENNKYEAKAAVTVLNKLVSIDKIDLLYNWGEATLQAIAPIVEKRKLATLALSLDARPSKESKYVVRTINHSQDLAKTMLTHLKSDRFKNVCLVMTEDSFITSFVEGYESELGRDRLTILANVHSEEQDLRSVVLKVRSSKCDVLGVLLFPGQISSFFKQLKAIGITIPLFGTDFFESYTEIENAAGGMQGALYPSFAIPHEFILQYKARYRDITQVSYAYNAYMTTLLIAETHRNRVSENEQLVDLFPTEMSGFFKEKGVSRKHSKEGGSYYSYPLVVKKIDDNSFAEAL